MSEAEIGPAMLRGTPVQEGGRVDYRALGLLMIRLMEPSTSMLDPETLSLSKPDLWDDRVKGFLAKTSSASGDVLRKVYMHPARRI